MDWKPHIEETDDARVRGTSARVDEVLARLAAGWSHERLAEEFPGLTSESIRACIAFANEEVRKARLRATIERRIASADAGNTIPHEEVKRFFEEKYGKFDGDQDE